MTAPGKLRKETAAKCKVNDITGHRTFANCDTRASEPEAMINDSDVTQGHETDRDEGPDLTKSTDDDGFEYDGI